MIWRRPEPPPFPLFVPSHLPPSAPPRFRPAGSPRLPARAAPYLPPPKPQLDALDCRDMSVVVGPGLGDAARPPSLSTLRRSGDGDGNGRVAVLPPAGGGEVLPEEGCGRVCRHEA